MLRRYGLALALTLLVLCQGCYGPFNAVRSLHKWNGNVSENRWANEGVFLVLNIVPVYGLWAFGDSIIFNSIEFWGGADANPISPPSDD